MALAPVRPADGHGGAAVGGRPVAELAKLVAAPGAGGAVGEQRQAVVGALAPASFTPLMAVTATGRLRVVVLPSPSWPVLLAPQARGVPSASSTRLVSPWTLRALAPLSPLTGPGVKRLKSVPVPSGAIAIVAPGGGRAIQQHGHSCGRSPSRSSGPPLSPLTATGVCAAVLVPSPSWPVPLNPQAWTVPSTSSASVLAPARDDGHDATQPRHRRGHAAVRRGAVAKSARTGCYPRCARSHRRAAPGCAGRPRRWPRRRSAR